MGETGGKKMEDPHSLKSNEMAQCSFQPQQPLVCDTFKNCEGLSLSLSWMAMVLLCWARSSRVSARKKAIRAARKSKTLFHFCIVVQLCTGFIMLNQTSSSALIPRSALECSAYSCTRGLLWIGS